MTRAEPFLVSQGTGGRRVLPEGVTEWDLRSGRYRRLFSRVFISSVATVTPVVLAEAALLLADPGSVASHRTAARIWGGVVPGDGHVHLTCVGGRLPKVKGVRAHRVRPGQLATVHRGVRVTTVETTFLDLADGLGLVDLVVLGDSLVRLGVVTPEQLVAAAATFTGRSRARARRAASLVRRDVDSPMESRLRMLIVLAGLPEPVVNHKIHWADGRVRWRFDLSYPEYRIIIEYDGMQHRESDRQWSTDIGRREWMDNENWRIVVVIGTGVYRTPATTLGRVIAVMRARGMGVPRLSDEWRAHFPSLPGDITDPLEYGDAPTDSGADPIR
ncbi:hypothetical protein [Intrasporangium sp.]|uniref:hypothetical protein n=1 Tax=Intrasporangium sp. TaxID=1925024 RepID=UPI003221B08D